MTRKSKREIQREVEQAREKLTPEPDFNFTTEVNVIMEREKAEANGREILGEVGNTTRIVTWFDEDGTPYYGSPEHRVPDGLDLVKVAPNK